MKDLNMRKYLIAAALLVMTVTSASAQVVCRPFYRSIWDVASNQYVTVRGPDTCFEEGPTYYQPPYYPGPAAVPEPYYPGPVAAPEPYYDGGAEFFMGAVVGGLTGYAIGNNNNGGGNKNNYYYYNNRKNYNGGGYYKRRHHRHQEYRQHNRRQEYRQYNKRSEYRQRNRENRRQRYKNKQ